MTALHIVAEGDHAHLLDISEEELRKMDLSDDEISFLEAHQFDPLVDVFRAGNKNAWDKADELLRRIPDDPMTLRADSRLLSDARETLAEAGHSYSTRYLAVMRSTAKAFPEAERTHNVAFSHYRRVVELVSDSEAQHGWLAIADEKRWNQAELDAAINTEKAKAHAASRAPAPTPAPPVVSRKEAAKAKVTGPVITPEGVEGGEPEVEPEAVAAPDAPFEVDPEQAKGLLEANPEAFAKAIGEVDYEVRRDFSAEASKHAKSDFARASEERKRKVSKRMGAALAKMATFGTALDSARSLKAVVDTALGNTRRDFDDMKPIEREKTLDQIRDFIALLEAMLTEARELLGELESKM